MRGYLRRLSYTSFVLFLTISSWDGLTSKYFGVKFEYEYFRCHLIVVSRIKPAKYDCSVSKRNCK